MNKELIQAVKHLIDTGCHYRIDELEKLYTKDLQILIVQENGDVMNFDYDTNQAFFRQLAKQKAPPMDTGVVFNYADVQDGIGYVIATRQMDLGFGKKKIVFTLMLRKSTHWQVFREHAVIVGDV